MKKVKILIQENKDFKASIKDTNGVVELQNGTKLYLQQDVVTIPGMGEFYLYDIFAGAFKEGDIPKEISMTVGRQRSSGLKKKLQQDLS